VARTRYFHSPRVFSYSGRNHLQAITSNLAQCAAEMDGAREQSRLIVFSVECEIRRRVQILPAPAKLRQPKCLLQTPQQRGSIRSQEVMTFDIPSKVPLRTASPGTLMRLLLS